MSLKDVVDEVRKAHAAIDEASTRLRQMESDLLDQVVASAAGAGQPVVVPKTPEQAAVLYIVALQQLQACGQFIGLSAPGGSGEWKSWIRWQSEMVVDQLRRAVAL